MRTTLYPQCLWCHSELYCILLARCKHREIIANLLTYPSEVSSTWRRDFGRNTKQQQQPQQQKQQQQQRQRMTHTKKQIRGRKMKTVTHQVYEGRTWLSRASDERDSWHFASVTPYNTHNLTVNCRLKWNIIFFPCLYTAYTSLTVYISLHCQKHKWKPDD